MLVLFTLNRTDQSYWKHEWKVFVECVKEKAIESGLNKLSGDFVATKETNKH